MDYNNILSKNNQNLDFIAEVESKNYQNSFPYPHIVLSNFFDEFFLNKVFEEFPDLSKIDSSKKYMNKNEIKFANNKYDCFPNSIKRLIEFLNSDYYLKFLQKITSIKEKLIIDPELNGGGLHEIKKGGILKIHTDFNKHPKLNLDRRLNVLLYLNKDWNMEYGGDLELWDKDLKNCKKKISPSFNKMVIFSTNDYSYHGHPDPVNCPEHMSRKSLALYYFSKGRPSTDIDSIKVKNKTYFEDRFGFKNETNNDTKSFKNYFRRFKFYKIMKSIEKKYLRKKNKFE
jgi:Rps23 Pro-64 3,4-dihydroxylase Tpa1-like proline 4-hydroxylase